MSSHNTCLNKSLPPNFFSMKLTSVCSMLMHWSTGIVLTSLMSARRPKTKFQLTKLIQSWNIFKKCISLWKRLHHYQNDFFILKSRSILEILLETPKLSPFPLLKSIPSEEIICLSSTGNTKVQSNPSFLKIGEEYFIKALGCTLRGSLETIVKYRSILAKGNCRSFSDYEWIIMAVWKISNHNPDTVVCAVCTCQDHLQNMCKHTYGLAVLLGYLDVPWPAKAIPLGMKPNFGRPAKVKKALILL